MVQFVEKIKIKFEAKAVQCAIDCDMIMRDLTSHVQNSVHFFCKYIIARRRHIFYFD